MDRPWHDTCMHNSTGSRGYFTDVSGYAFNISYWIKTYFELIFGPFDGAIKHLSGFNKNLLKTFPSVKILIQLTEAEYREIILASLVYLT